MLLSVSNKFTILPHSLVNFAAFVDEFAPACSLSVHPVSYIVVAVRVNVSAVTMVDIVLELTLVNDMVDLLTNSLNSTISADLTYDELVVLALAKLQGLINWFRAVLDDVLKPERAKF